MHIDIINLLWLNQRNPIHAIIKGGKEMLKIKWTVGLFTEYGTQYVCRSETGEYYLSPYVCKSTLIMNKPNDFLLYGDLMWMPITYPLAVWIKYWDYYWLFVILVCLSCHFGLSIKF